MTEPQTSPQAPSAGQETAPEAHVSEAPPRVLTPEAQRALAEAEERRKAAQAEQAPAEINGRGGLDPVRYGDWEIKGLTSDF